MVEENTSMLTEVTIMGTGLRIKCWEMDASTILTVQWSTMASGRTTSSKEEESSMEEVVTGQNTKGSSGMGRCRVTGECFL